MPLVGASALHWHPKLAFICELFENSPSNKKITEIMALPHKKTLQALHRNIATAQDQLAQETAHQAAVQRLIQEIESAVMADNWEPTTGVYASRVVNDVIDHFKTTEYTVALIESNRKSCRFKVS